VTIKAPFPWFGGKSKVAAEVWQRFGDVPNYVEPFAGSAAMLLARPEAHQWWERTETINDFDGFVANFWRAVRDDPEAVARHADWPINENDLHARHAWLVARSPELRAALEGDPAYYDAQVAGWWVWGLCLWIGSGWCSGNGPWRVVDGKLVHLGNDGQGINRKRVHLGNDGRGINRQLVHLGDAGQGINRKRVHLGNDGRGLSDEWSEHLRQMMTRLSDRLRRVRVCSGDWSRVTGPSPTTKNGITAVFLDPPYSQAERHDSLYREEMVIAEEVREWAIEHGNDPLFRIALCGYDGEHAMPDGWQAYAWKAKGGYGSQGTGRGRENSAREVVWFSPHCLVPDKQQGMLF
jgi:DNA adenine methylase